jgi:hypothetical protein
MYWLLAAVGASAYVLYTKSLPKPIRPIEPLSGVYTPGGGWMWPASTLAGSNYAVKPGRYVTGQGAQTDVGLPNVAPPTKNGAPGKQPFQ